MNANAGQEQHKAEDYGAVEIANHLLDRFGIAKNINSIKDCDDEYFLILYEAITGELPFGVVKNPHRKEDRTRNCQLVIDSLSKEVLETDLSHIQARDIVDCNAISVANLLEIFMGLLEYIFEELRKEEDEDVMKEHEQRDEDDSNLLPNDHQLLSDVLHEEFGNADQAVGSKASVRPESIMEKYLMPTEAPTRDTDTESSSSHDFTQDSLYNQRLKTTPKNGNAHTTFDVHPFAYVSSSCSNSIENLAKEAINISNMKNDKKNVASASTTRLNKTANEEPPSYNVDFRNTDPVLYTTISKKRYQRAASPESSMSSAKWPSVLKTNELNDNTADNPYKDLGKRPRDLLPFEVNKVIEDAHDTASVKHQHTHHHYHHYSASQAKEAHPVDNTAKAGRSSPPKSSVRGSKTTWRNGMLSEEKGITRQENASRIKDLWSSKLGDAKADQSKQGTISEKKNQPSRMRSVQTSVSGLETSARPKQEVKNVKFPDEKPIESGSEPDRSSVSELNELLNIGNETSTRITSRSDALKELDRKLEEVRAAVKNPYENRLLSLDPNEENIESPKKHVSTTGKEKTQSSLSHQFLPDGDSIYSDSEFDYDYSSHLKPMYPDDDKATPKRKGLDDERQRFLKDFLNRDDQYSTSRKNLHRNKKKVQFKDFISEGRDERLERLMNSLRREQNENKEKIQTVKNIYSNDLKSTRKKNELRLKDDRKRDLLPKKTLQTVAPNKDAVRLAKIYGHRPRAKQREVSKQRKRSASCSPIPRARRRGRLVIDEEDLIPLMEDEFPHLYLSPVTAKMMWQKQMRQISNLAKTAHIRKPTIVEKRIEESKKKQEALMDIMKKEVEHNKRLKEAREKAQEKRQVKNKLRERRLASARARRYYDDYQVRMRSRMLKRKSKEEKVFKQLFEDALEIQKERIRELREYAKEQRTMDAQRKQNELESIDNFYRDQFAMMAESVARERYDIQIREKAQSKVLENMRKGIRQRMEKDIKDLQQQLIRDEDSAHFRQLDADTMKKELQLATYKVRM